MRGACYTMSRALMAFTNTMTTHERAVNLRSESSSGRFDRAPLPLQRVLWAARFRRPRLVRDALRPDLPVEAQEVAADDPLDFG